MTSVAENVLSFDVVSDLLKDVVIKENVIDPIYEISSGSVKGDGYSSFMTKVNIRGKNKVLPVIIKSAHKLTKLRESLPLRLAFLQEIKYYEEIFPAFKKFQSEIGIKYPFNALPVCYKTIDLDNDEALILENIKENGFKVFDKKVQMDKAHVEMVLKTYGQLHAISFSMKDHNMPAFMELTKNIDWPFSTKHFQKEFFDLYLDGIQKMTSVFDENTESDESRYISSLKDKLMPFFKSLDNYSGNYSVFTHGDCWCNNMMFKYEEEKSTPPIEMRLIDFQIGTLTTPVLDLSYFFYVSASQNMLDNLDYYLQVYHDSLRKHMLEMGSDVEQYYPIAALKDEWKQFAKFGLILALFVYRVMLRDDDEILDLTDETDEMKDVFMKGSKQDQLINERYRRLALHFYNNKLI